MKLEEGKHRESAFSLLIVVWMKRLAAVSVQRERVHIEYGGTTVWQIVVSPPNEGVGCVHS